MRKLGLQIKGSWSLRGREGLGSGEMGRLSLFFADEPAQRARLPGGVWPVRRGVPACRGLPQREHLHPEKVATQVSGPERTAQIPGGVWALQDEQGLGLEFGNGRS